MRKKAPRARFSLRLPFDSAIIRTHPGVHQSCFAALVKKFRHNLLDAAQKSERGEKKRAAFFPHPHPYKKARHFFSKSHVQKNIPPTVAGAGVCNKSPPQRLRTQKTRKKSGISLRKE
jgi:hypothetical protein